MRARMHACPHLQASVGRLRGFACMHACMRMCVPSPPGLCQQVEGVCMHACVPSPPRFCQQVEGVCMRACVRACAYLHASASRLRGCACVCACVRSPPRLCQQVEGVCGVCVRLSETECLVVASPCRIPTLATAVGDLHPATQHCDYRQTAERYPPHKTVTGP